MYDHYRKCPKNERETEECTSRFIGFIPVGYADKMRQAAQDAGFSIVLDPSNRPQPGDIGVFTNELPGRDHGPLWQRYRELKRDKGA